MSANKLPGFRWVILTIVCLICFTANFVQYSVSAWGVVVMETMGISVADLSNLMLAPMLTAVFLSIPAGTLADRYGVKNIVCVGLVASVIGGFVRCFTLDSFVLQLVSMFLVGGGIACLNANLAKVLGTWFQEQTSLAMGLFYAVSCVAIVLAQALSTLFGSVYMTYLVMAVFQTVVAVLWFVLMKNQPAGTPAPEPEPVVQYLGVAAKSKNVWRIAFAYGLTLASTSAYAMILPSALELGRGVDTMLAGSMAAIITVGSFFACLVAPAVCLKMGRNKPFLFLSTIIGAAVMFGNWFMPLGAGMWAVLVLNGFFSALSGPIIQSLTYELPEIGAKFAGSAGGIVATVGLLCSYAIPIVVSMIAGDNWALNLGIESALFLVSIVCFIGLPETGAKAAAAQSVAAEA